MSDGHPNSPEEGPAAGPAAPQGPRRLCDMRALAALRPAPAGALWKLSEPGRQLDANLVHLPPHQRIETHTEPDLDVLLLVASGGGTLSGPDGVRQLTAGELFWLPHGSTRRITADPDGLSYLTVHRRRPGMRIATARS